VIAHLVVESGSEVVRATVVTLGLRLTEFDITPAPGAVR